MLLTNIRPRLSSCRLFSRPISTFLSSKIKDQSLLREDAFVDGKWTSGPGATPSRFPVENPATGDVLANVANLSKDDTEKAIQVASKAFSTWKDTTAKERADILLRWYNLILSNKSDLAVIMTAENGKPLKESEGEIEYGASFVRWFAEEARRTYGDVIPSHASGKRILVLKQPVGVVGAITPWNFPSSMITRKCAPALAAGCTVVLRPADATPLSALALAELADRAGVPPGVFNIITSDGPKAKEIGLELCTHPLVRKIGFTGSTAVGRELMAQAASTVKKVSLELGGNAPFIVFDDADLDAAVEGAIISKFRNAGQTCVCANRMLVQESVLDKFTDKLATRIKQLKQGDGFEEGIQVGPLINKAAIDKVHSLVEDSIKNGARAIVGASLSPLGGLFYSPTLLSGAPPSSRIFHEEIFGPVASITPFKTEEEAVHLANDTIYGLAAYFYSKDLGRVWRVSESLDYGMVAVNDGALSTEVAPFGGVKQSGLGREGSKYGLEEFIETKYVLLSGLKG